MPDRRARRRRETIDEILELAVDIMAEQGVTGVTMAEVARRLGVQPPSLYKYFPSLMSLYDTLFQRGHAEHRDAVKAAMDAAPPGMATVIAAAEATGHWAVAHPMLTQLMFWRPVPGFTPSAEAMAPSVEMVQLYASALACAVEAGELGAEAAGSEGVAMLSTMIAGVMSQHLANEPEMGWGEGMFVPLLPRLVRLLPHAYPPRPKRRTK
ncbi:TetR/AcrR family transcriptional regulator [Geodermatophilus sp. SYSU D00758]